MASLERPSMESGRTRMATQDHAWIFANSNIWEWFKHRYPKWNPGKWNQGLKPTVSWCLNFDPYPYVGQLALRLAGRTGSNRRDFSCELGTAAGNRRCQEMLRSL